MPTSIEAQGVTVEEAIQIALNQLGVTRDRVEIEILHHPRTGFLGLGARRAKVRATVREAFLADGEEYDMATGAPVGRGARRSRRSRRRRGRRGDGRPEQQEASPRRGESREARRNEPEPRRGEARGRSREDSRSREEGRGREERSAQREEGRWRDERGGQREEGRGRDERGGQREEGRGRDERGGQREEGRGRDERGGRDRGRRSKERRGREGRYDDPRAGDRARGPASEPRPDRGESMRRSEPDGTTEFRAAPEAADAAARAPYAPSTREDVQPAENDAPPTRIVPTEELRRRSETVLGELLRRMGFQAVVSSTFDADEGEIVVTVESDAEGLLIGRRGQTLDALEHLVNRMALAGEAAGDARIAIDVGGYRQRRRDTLVELADRLKGRALSQGRRIQVSPMSPRDRRILQGVLGRDETVRTRVLGTGFYRRVLIAPAGLDEESIPLEADEEEGADAQPGADEEGSA